MVIAPTLSYGTFTTKSKPARHTRRTTRAPRKQTMDKEYTTMASWRRKVLLRTMPMIIYGLVLSYRPVLYAMGLTPAYIIYPQLGALALAFVNVVFVHEAYFRNEPKHDVKLRRIIHTRLLCSAVAHLILLLAMTKSFAVLTKQLSEQCVEQEGSAQTFDFDDYQYPCSYSEAWMQWGFTKRYGPLFGACLYFFITPIEVYNCGQLSKLLRTQRELSRDNSWDRSASTTGRKVGRDAAVDVEKR